MEQEVVKDFVYRGRRCVIIKVNTLFMIPYCNGYIELKDEEVLDDYSKYEIESDEITYQGKLIFPNLSVNLSDGKKYIGFDSAHYWNDERLESKDASYVERTCKKIVDELEAKEE